MDIRSVADENYKYGFTSDIDTEYFPKGISEEIIRRISEYKQEPEWLLDFRLEAYRKWQRMKEPTWAHLHYPPINYDDIIYFAVPRKKKKLDSMDEVDPKLREMFDKLGISLEEQKRLANVSEVAVDAVVDSESVKTTYQETLRKQGIIFCSFGEAVREHPELVRKYLGKAVPSGDNFFAALNSAVFSDGSFCYIP
ncbi:MAG: Fe-S cluster assembly protein SufB, partial [Selenomonadaceae bacterium]|nr:Fe-S cluster assembly protein SufB [Selenomonadaceae bacterium]